jgi:predicted XRE-type DNA-binding protein
MFLDCPSVIDFWNQLTNILHKLLGPYQLQKKQILYGYHVLHTTPKHLANYLIVLAKSTIYKTFLAAADTHITMHPTIHSCSDCGCSFVSNWKCITAFGNLSNLLAT